MLDKESPARARAGAEDTAAKHEAAAAEPAVAGDSGDDEAAAPAEPVTPAAADEDDPDDEEEETAASISSGAVSSARRLGESFLIAILTSTGLYLVGSVYTDAYYSRMSIEVNALNLPTTYVAVQASHVLSSLLGYPTAFLIFWGIYRVLSRRARWVRSAYGWARGRFERAVLLITNLVVVTPLVLDAARAVSRGVVPSTTTIAEVSNLLGTTAMLLVGYAIWLSVGPRRTFFTEVRQRRLIPIALLAVAYLFSALIDTAGAGSEAASTFLLGKSENSLGVEFTMRPDRAALAPDADLLLVTIANGNYFVVERQSDPPARRPVSFMVPMASVDFASVRRINDANLSLDEMIVLEIEQMSATPAASPTP